VNPILAGPDSVIIAGHGRPGDPLDNGDQKANEDEKGSLLRPERLHLIFVPQLMPEQSNVTSRPPETTSHTSSDEEIIGEIYLCSPQANSALEKIAPAFKPNLEKPTFRGVELPCWFADKNLGNGEVQKIIFIPENGEELLSPAEECYREANKLGRRAPFGPPSPIQVDYAIVLRLTVGRQKYLTVAGIHQYGTWIAGDFLRSLITEERLASTDVLGERDFLAVIFGEFDSRDLSVRRFGTLRDLLWLRRADTWARYDVEGPPKVKAAIGAR
jgi:hypothetical protein